MQRKDEEIKVRVAPNIKRLVQRAARSRGEGESVIVREALNSYLAEQFPDALHELPPDYRTKSS